MLRQKRKLKKIKNFRAREFKKKKIDFIYLLACLFKLTLLFKGLGLVRFFKASSVYQACIYLIKNTVKTNTVK